MTSERAGQRPNILVLFPDHHRYDWLGCNEQLPLRTPTLDALAARGVRFRDAVCPSPLCAPSRACLAAGMEYDRCRVPGNGTDYPLDQPTFYAMLKGSGYHVSGCGKFDLHKASYIWGTDGTGLIHDWGFSGGIDNEGKLDGTGSYCQEPRGAKGPYLAYLQSRGLAETHVEDFGTRRGNHATHATPLDDEAYCDNWVGANALRLLDRAPTDRPWFLQVNFTGPHPPWDITESMTALYDGSEFPGPVHATNWADPGRYNPVHRNFAAMIENIDRLCGEIIAEVARRGGLDNTLVVYSSDHGDMLGDHDQWGKSKPRHGSACVPLIAAGPGVRGGYVHDGPATTLDLTATFLEAAGLEVPADMDSRSMTDLLAGQTDTHRECVFSGLGDWRMVYDGTHKLIGRADGTRTLFDLGEDPGENTDLSECRPDIVAELADLLRQHTTIPEA